MPSRALVIPFGLLVTSAVVDVVHLLTGQERFSSAAGHLIAAGLLLGLVTAAIGWLERIFGAPLDAQERRAFLRHGLFTAGVLVLFAASWSLRVGAEGWQPAWPALALSWAGVLAAAFGGALGGRPVEEDAQPDTAGALRTA